MIHVYVSSPKDNILFVYTCTVYTLEMFVSNTDCDYIVLRLKCPKISGGKFVARGCVFCL